MAETELVEILERTISANPADQQRALQYIAQASEQHYPEFVQHLSRILVNVQNQQFVRQAAGLQLKNTLASNDEQRQQTNQQRWMALPDSIKDSVKECVLRTLGTEQRLSTAAQCIAAIACIEIQQGKWLEVFQILSNNITSPDTTEQQKEASLEAIGYICQSLPTSYMEAFANTVLTAIIHGMRAEQPSAHVRLSATTALFNSLEFTHNNFENEQERNVIMENVCQATQAADNATRVAALQCLVKIMSLYYQHMERYMISALYPITVSAMKSQIDEIELQGIEFWSNICEEETGLAIEAQEAVEEGRAPNQVSRHYAMGALQHLIPILTNILAKQEENPEDDDWIPAKAAGVCIMLLAQCCRDAIIEPTLPFITSNFHNPDWHYREAAVMAFGSILDGPDPGTLLRLVEQAIGPLIERVKDPHIAVRDTAVWAVGRVCDLCVELVSKPEVIHELLPALFETLGQQPRVASNACWTISSLVKATYRAASDHSADSSGEPETYILSSCFENMIQELVKTSERPDANNALRNAAFEALMELIKNSPRDCYHAVQQTTMIVIKKMEQFLNVEEESLSSASDRSQLRDLISQLCATLQSVLRKIQPNDLPIVSDQIMNILLKIMNRYQGRDNGAVMEEALMAVSALISVMKSDFSRFMEHFKPILFFSLANYVDKELCVNALGVISDLCTAFENQIKDYSDDIVAGMIKLLDDPAPDRMIKCHVIEVLGDVINALGTDYIRYLEPTMGYVLQAAATSSTEVVAADDFDKQEYISNLRESCICVFTSIAQAFNASPEHKALMQAYLPHMVALIQVIATSQPPASEHLLSTTIALIGDLLVAYNVEFLPIVDSEPITNMMQRLRRSRQNKAKAALNWVSREVQRVRRMAETKA
ncbi:Importin N-terminal domain-containing protein [Aphelenchoides besseyi]|nr:Importin N-terminal domain-containing protein [Aphelenchoides besseyi]KAI6207814.1 Importin N-terminal domain-containing protein [Aphelenchoides besseyi]